MADDVLSPEMIEVDPKLFITCRLCLEDMGVYQIVPTVQQQIKYCFDINVEPFDGLPQLLCKKCKVILDEYSSNKKKYIDKQQSLIARLKVKQIQSSIVEDKADSSVSSSSFALPRPTTPAQSSPKPSTLNNDYNDSNDAIEEYEIVPQPESVNSAENSAHNSESDIKQPKSKSYKNNRKRKSRLMSYSSSGTEASNTFKKKAKKHRNKSPKWYRKYKKQFVCNICSNTYNEKRKLKKHFNAHSNIKSKYDFVLSKECRVKLIKCDGKPNITDSNNTVFVDKRKIIQAGGNSLYHILYIARDTDTNDSNEKSKKHKSDYSEKYKSNYSESSDDDFVVTRKNKRKLRRISRSSNETVLLGDMNKTRESLNADLNETSRTRTSENKETECINIDDSSDDNTDVDNSAKSKPTTNNKVEFKTIENIISNCRLKYMKKLESAQNASNNSKKMICSEAQLKHKLLSIGRKNIYKEGPHYCTGLLRFMEHKNLNIQWLPNNLPNSLVRIMTKLKSACDNDNTNDKSGWIFLPETGRDSPNSTESNVVATNAEKLVNESSFCNIVTKTATATTLNAANINTESVNSAQTLSIIHKTSAVLYQNSQNADADSNLKKILNAFPVPNPKQLPKKSNVSDSKAKNAVEVRNYVIELDGEQTSQLNEEENYSVPIITSTTSLAVPKSEPSDTAKAPDKSLPRIKVKPVSELMNPPNARINENSNVNTINNIWSINNLENRVTPNIDTGTGNLFIHLVPQIQSVQSLQVPLAPAPERNVLSVNRVTSGAANIPTPDVITLHSVELPNTRTDSPFKYLKDLLLMHNLILLDLNSPITQDYTGLIRMKVQFKQESKEVVLCFSLFCQQNAFCICIKNNNNVDIPMAKLSAVWQWEIIKIFQGDHSSKILDNAMKAGNFVYKNTKTFLSVLKSITSDLP